MRLLIFCAVFSVLLAVSFAGPVKTTVRDVADSSSASSGESVEHSSISTEEEEEVKNENLVKDEINDASSSEEVKIQPSRLAEIVVDDADDVPDLSDLTPKNKRSLYVDHNSNTNNHLKVKQEGSIKYEKNVKVNRLRRELESNESDINDSNGLRFVRQADTSEENSSEEKKPKQEEAQPARRRRSADTSEEDSSEEGKHSAPAVVLAAKPETAPAESHPNPDAEAKAETARRRRNVESSEENSSEEQAKQTKTTSTSADLNLDSPEDNHEANEVFVFSHEQQPDSEENLKSKTLETNKYVVLSENSLSVTLDKKKSSDEDYAQGCGNNDDSSTDNSKDEDETNFD